MFFWFCFFFILRLNAKKWMLLKTDSFEVVENFLETFLTLKYCIGEENNCVKKRAKMYSFALNLLLGVLVSLFLYFDPHFDWLEWLSFGVFHYMEVLMVSLEAIINWLMGVPVGLKLNKPLNEFLGRLFLYHIYLWNSKLFCLFFQKSLIALSKTEKESK